MGVYENREGRIQNFQTRGAVAEETILNLGYINTSLFYGITMQEGKSEASECLWF